MSILKSQNKVLIGAKMLNFNRSTSGGIPRFFRKVAQGALHTRFEHLPIFEDAKVLKLVVIVSSVSNLFMPEMMRVWHYLHWRLQCLAAGCWRAPPEAMQ
jgi:hypothetical protein